MKKQNLYIVALLATFAGCSHEMDTRLPESREIPVGITVQSRSLTPNDPQVSNENNIEDLLFSAGELKNSGNTSDNVSTQPWRKEHLQNQQSLQRITLPLKWEELTRFGFLHIWANTDKMPQRKADLLATDGSYALKEFLQMERACNYNTTGGVQQSIPENYYQPPFLMLCSAVSAYGKPSIFSEDQVGALQNENKQLEMVRMVAKVSLELASAAGTTGIYQITKVELLNTPTEFYPYFSYCTTEMPWMFHADGKYPYYGASDPTSMPDIYSNIYDKTEKQAVRALTNEVASEAFPLAVPAAGQPAVARSFYILPMHTTPNLDANGTAPPMRSATTLQLTLKQPSNGKTKQAVLRLDGANTYTVDGKAYTARGILPNYAYIIKVSVTDGDMGDPVSVAFTYTSIPWDNYTVDVPEFK